jgi:uncharacterized membrane protein YhaH (DUF805 family)
MTISIVFQPPSFRSGYYCALFVIPVINLIFQVLLVFTPGDRGTNDYGPPLLHFMR